VTALNPAEGPETGGTSVIISGSGFTGATQVLFGSFADSPWVVVIATFGLVLSSVYSLAMIHRAYFGPTKAEGVLDGLDAREVSMVLVLALLLVLLGIFPQQVFDTSHATMDGVHQWLDAALSPSVSAR